MRKLNGMVMMPKQDPDECLTQVLLQRDDLDNVGESFIEARILDLTLEGLSAEYDLIRFPAEQNPDIMMRITYVNHVTQGDGSTFSRGKGRESAMAASSGFKRSCGYCNKAGHKKAQCFKFLRESDRGPLPSSSRRAPDR